MNLTIRKAIESDARKMAEVNIYTWLSTYKGILPDEILNDRLNRIDTITNEIANSIKENDNALVAEVDGNVVGILSYGKSRYDKCLDCGEIYSIYVLEKYQGKGIGKKLFIEGVKQLNNLGYSKFILYVLKGNPAIEFYKNMGGKIIDSKKDYIRDVEIEELIFEFENMLKNNLN